MKPTRSLSDSFFGDTDPEAAIVASVMASNDFEGAEAFSVRPYVSFKCDEDSEDFKLILDDDGDPIEEVDLETLNVSLSFRATGRLAIAQVRMSRAMIRDCEGSQLPELLRDIFDRQIAEMTKQRIAKMEVPFDFERATQP